MDLILWRHAEAAAGHDDAARRLTAKGATQAAQMAAWLDARLPPGARLLVSPTVRAQQTAALLAREARTSSEVGTAAQPLDLLRAAGWPAGRGTVVVVGHQPTLGTAAALVLTGRALPWPVMPGSIWWLTTRGDTDASLVAVMSPELLHGR